MTRYLPLLTKNGSIVKHLEFKKGCTPFQYDVKHILIKQFNKGWLHCKVHHMIPHQANPGKV